MCHCHCHCQSCTPPSSVSVNFILELSMSSRVVARWVKSSTHKKVRAVVWQEQCDQNSQSDVPATPQHDPANSRNWPHSKIFSSGFPHPALHWNTEPRSRAMDVANFEHAKTQNPETNKQLRVAHVHHLSTHQKPNKGCSRCPCFEQAIEVHLKHVRLTLALNRIQRGSNT